jgi:hypothetical protein
MAIIWFIVGVIGRALSRVLADDLKEWTPIIVEKLIQLALSKLPADHQERFAEEWRSHVKDVPGHIAKLSVAVGCNLAVLKIRVEMAYLSLKRKLSTTILYISFLGLVMALLCGLFVGKIVGRTSESTAKPSAEEAVVMVILLVVVVAMISSKPVKYKLS